MRKRRLILTLVILGTFVITAIGLSQWCKPTYPEPQLLWKSSPWLNTTPSPDGALQITSAFNQDQLITTGLVQEPAVYTYNGDLVWQFQADQVDEKVSISSLSIAGLVLVGTNKGNVYLFDADCSRRWVYSIENSGKDVSCYPVSDITGTVYIPTKDKLVAINSDGSLRWQAAIPEINTRVVPVVGQNGLIYVVGEESRLIALSSSGVELWRTNEVVCNARCLLYHPDGLIVFPNSTGFVGYDSDGQCVMSWHVELNLLESTQLLSNGSIIAQNLSSKENNVFASTLFSFTTTNNKTNKYDIFAFSGMCVSSDSLIYIVETSIPLMRIPPKAWNYIPKWVFSQFGNGQTQLLVMTTDFHVVKQCKITSSMSPPIPLHDGSVLIFGDDRCLYCYK